MRSTCLALLLSLAGCGSAVDRFAELPRGSDVGDTPWPRLVDTPDLPAGTLMREEGAQAAARLDRRRTESALRLARAEAAMPIGGGLEARGAGNLARVADPGPGIDEADLLARAERLRQRASLPSPEPVSSPVLQPPRPPRGEAVPVVSDAFERRAREALARAAQAGR